MSRGCCCSEPPTCSMTTSSFESGFFPFSLSGWTLNTCGQGGSFDIGPGSTLRGATGSTGGVFTRNVTRPSLNGLGLWVRANISFPLAWDGQPASAGITVGDAFAFQFTSSTGVSIFRTDSNGCFSSGVENYTFSTTNVLDMYIIDISEGSGVYSIAFCLGGNLINGIDEIELSLPDPLKIGVIYDFTSAGPTFRPLWSTMLVGIK